MSSAYRPSESRINRGSARALYILLLKPYATNTGQVIVRCRLKTAEVVETIKRLEKKIDQMNKTTDAFDQAAARKMDELSRRDQQK
jgi:hypothetical protein